jgi:hypothetical protein
MPRTRRRSGRSAPGVLSNGVMGVGLDPLHNVRALITHGPADPHIRKIAEWIRFEAVKAGSLQSAVGNAQGLCSFTLGDKCGMRLRVVVCFGHFEFPLNAVYRRSGKPYHPRFEFLSDQTKPLIGQKSLY